MVQGDGRDDSQGLLLMDRDKVIDTIQKLLRLRDGTNSQAEAESAAAKVQELLFKYNLDMAEVDATATQEERLVGQEFFETGERKNESTWIRILYNTVARYNFCKAVYFSGAYTENPHGVKIAVIGRAANVEVVHYTVEWLVPNIRRMADESFKTYTGSEKRGRFKRGFLIGCVEGVGNKLYAEWQHQQQMNEKSTALVVRNDAELSQFMQDTYPKLSSGRRSSLTSWEGRTAGQVAGQSMQIRRGVKGDKIGGYLR